MSHAPNDPVAQHLQRLTINEMAENLITILDCSDARQGNRTGRGMVEQYFVERAKQIGVPELDENIKQELLLEAARKIAGNTQEYNECIGSSGSTNVAHRLIVKMQEVVAARVASASPSSYHLN